MRNAKTIKTTKEEKIKSLKNHFVIITDQAEKSVTLSVPNAIHNAGVNAYKAEAKAAPARRDRMEKIGRAGYEAFISCNGHKIAIKDYREKVYPQMCAADFSKCQSIYRNMNDIAPQEGKAAVSPFTLKEFIESTRTMQSSPSGLLKAWNKWRKEQGDDSVNATKNPTAPAKDRKEAEAEAEANQTKLRKAPEAGKEETGIAGLVDSLEVAAMAVENVWSVMTPDLVDRVQAITKKLAALEPNKARKVGNDDTPKIAVNQ